MSQLRRLSALATILRWLGPWSDGTSPPGGVTRESWTLRRGDPCGKRAHDVGHRRTQGAVPCLEAYLYRASGNASPLGVWLVAPGLHFLGPDDPRLDRFCRVLARAGFWVLAPFLPGYVDLEVSEAAADDLEVCARALLERAQARKLSLFSISFGSWPALEVAARLGEAADGVVTFGGYADFGAAVRFCADGLMRAPTGDIELARDPLNMPALFLNLLPHLEGVNGDTTTLARAYREMAYRTWGRVELKAKGRLEPFAQELVARVPEAQRELFLVGCGALPGAAGLVEGALRRAGDRFAFANPRPAIHRLACPVVVCHGRDDDVIPYGEAHKLHDLVVAQRVPARLLLTGLYGHTGAEKPKATDALKEGLVLLEIAQTLAAGGALRERFS